MTVTDLQHSFCFHDQYSLIFQHNNYSTHFYASAVQAFVNLVLTLCDAGDSVVMFAPYYFNAYMSFQMTGITNILLGPGNPETLYPDVGKTEHDPVTNSLIYQYWTKKTKQFFL